MSPVSDIRDLGRHEADGATVLGWVQTTRVHGRVAFVVVLAALVPRPFCKR